MVHSIRFQAAQFCLGATHDPATRKAHIPLYLTCDPDEVETRRDFGFQYPRKPAVKDRAGDFITIGANPNEPVLPPIQVHVLGIGFVPINKPQILKRVVDLVRRATFEVIDEQLEPQRATEKAKLAQATAVVFEQAKRFAQYKGWQLNLEA